MADSYEVGWWSCAYVVTPVPNPPSLPLFRQILFEIKGQETGWPVWLSLENRTETRAHIVGETIECWLRDVDDGDFCRADPRGRMYLMRRLQEDHDFPGIQPGRFLGLILPVWRAGECLLHAQCLAGRLKAENVHMAMTWSGLAGRELRSLAAQERMLMPGRICDDAVVSTSITTTAADISDVLPNLVKALVAPLYARFGFFEPADELYISELHRMRTGTR